MANQPSKYSKFLLGAASAALVASAVAPAVSAADFSDVKPNNTHRPAIDALTAAGIISGYPDGSFKPDQKLTRSDVVKMMGKWLVSLGNEVPADYKTNIRFTDQTATTNDELLKYSALVYDKGVFIGNNGKLDASGNITRENMAMVLVRAFDSLNETDLVATVKEAKFDRDVTDLATAKVEAQPYIDVLDYYDITNPAAPAFNPKGTTTRGQFASFLHKTSNVDASAEMTFKITAVTGLNDTNQFLQIDFSRAVKTGLEAADIQIKDSKSGDSYGVREVKLSADGKSAQVELFQPREGDIVLEYVKDYDVTVRANYETLNFVFNRPLFSEARITDIDVANNKFVAVDDKTGLSTTIKVLKDTEFDYQGAIGELVRVWYNGDKELVKSEIVSPSATYDAIEIDDKDTIKLLNADKKIDITDDKYNSSKNDDYKFKLFIDGKEVTTKDGQISSDIFKKRYNHAKIGYDKAGEIEYVSAYSLNEFLVFDKLDGKEVLGIEGDASASFNAKDATIIKDGKVIALSDLAKGDIVFFSNDADDKDGFAEVLNNKVSGKISDTFLESIRVDGKTYDFVHDTAESAKYAKKDYAKAVFLNDRDRLEYIDEDSAEELQAAGDVTLFFDRGGNLVYVSGDTADVLKNTKTSILTEDIKVKIDFGKVVAQFETVDQDGKDKLYQIDLENLKKIVINGKDYTIDKNAKDSNEWKVSEDGKNIVLTSGTGKVEKISFKAASSVVNFKLDDSNAVKELEFFTSTSAKEGYGETTKTVEAKDNYVGGKRLLSNTVVFDAKKAGSNGTIDEKDVKVTTWGEYKGSDIVSSYYIYNDDNEVIALVIKDTSSQDTVDEAALITNVLRNSDKEVIEITAFVNGAKKTYKVDEVKYNVEKGDIVVLEFDKDNSDIVDDIKSAGSKFVAKDLIVDSVDSGRREVTFVDGTVARLISNGLVLNGTDVTDITTKALSDLRGEKKKVTVIYDEEGSNFAKYFVYETISQSAYDKLKEEQSNATSPSAKVEKLIDALPKVADLKLADEDKVKEARAAYDALSSANKDKVAKSAVEKLEAAEAKIKELKDAENPPAKGDIVITTATAKGSALSSLFLDFDYEIAGTVADADVTEVVLTFTGESGTASKTVDVKDKGFTLSITGKETFGEFDKVEVSYETKAGEVVKASKTIEHSAR